MVCQKAITKFLSVTALYNWGLTGRSYGGRKKTVSKYALSRTIAENTVSDTMLV